jgi:hypothetical protein
MDFYLQCHRGTAGGEALVTGQVTCYPSLEPRHARAKYDIHFAQF